MGPRQSTADLLKPLHDPRRLLGALLLHDRREVASVEKFHDQKRERTEFLSHSCVDNAHHVFALDLRIRAGLSAEALAGFLVIDERERQELEREVFAGMNVLHDIHRAQPPLSEHADRSVAIGYERWEIV